MKSKQPSSTKENLLKSSVIIIIASFIPLVAISLNDDINWTALDFAAAWFLLITTGISYELLRLKVTNSKKRLIFSFILFLVFILIWLELAVGVVGTPFSGT